MSVHAHLEALAVKHRQLEDSLHEAYLHHDQESIKQIKHEKLRIKDEIARFLKDQDLAEAA